MPDAPYGYAGKLLRVDLDKRDLNSETLDETTLRSYIGGTCLGVKILYEEVPPGIKWSDPANRLIIASGPLGGTKIHGSGTYAVVTTGALTNGAANSQANGNFGAYLRFSGFDGIVVQGAAKEWSYLYVHDGQAEIKDAQHLLGLDTFQTEDAIKEELKQPGRELSVAAIGPAGENLVRFALIASDRGHMVAHNGIGAVMGSKKLKAIAVSRQGTVNVRDPEGLSLIAKEMMGLAKTRGFAGISIYDWGTLEGIRLSGGLSILPVKNMQTNNWKIEKEQFDKWSPEYIRTTFGVKRNPCWACQMHHCYTMKIKEGPYAGKTVEEPEYETEASCGPVIGNDDVVSAMVLGDDIDRLGLDVNETGWILAFVMECYEKGIITKEQTDGLEMTWGNVEAARAMVSKIAKREGFGNILAKGVMRAAQHIGGDAPNFAVHSRKGNTPRSHDHRIMWFELFDTCVSDTGTIESSSATLDLLGLPFLSNGFGFGLPDDVASLVAKTRGTMQFEDSLGVCQFNTLTNIPFLCQAVNAATGWDITFDEAMKIGRRAVNIMRLFNLRRNIGPELDRPSTRYGSTPVDGMAKGINSEAVWGKMIETYYELMGWDKKTGIPSMKTLEDLGLAHLVQDVPTFKK
ncbi:aldehyde ferredoxin oxidoreductase family protein [Chloroflexota bacterium]